MNFKRMWAMFTARNHEFFRDKAAFGWNFAFPFLIIVGFGLIFGAKEHQQFKIGLFSGETKTLEAGTESTVPLAFQQGKYLQFINFPNQTEGEQKLQHHKIDLLLDSRSPEHRYWINDSSPNGYIAEQIFLASLMKTSEKAADKQLVKGVQIRYIDWLFPGILGMNMMFSALWGVGYVVVGYRKNGALKRLKATPLTPLEYLSAQMLSRIFLIMFTLIVVWIGSDMIFHFQVHGSYATLALIFFLGGLSLCSMGLVLAARGTSEEFTSGILNFISWPMMFLSEVWFSLEGSPAWIQAIAKLFPLTHLLTGARKIMNDGATLVDVRIECLVLVLTTLISLTIAARLFSWNE
jgi:ABC-type multidrug transport system permease subunit